MIVTETAAKYFESRRIYLNLSTGFGNSSASPYGAGTSDIISSSLVMLVYIVISLAGALILFERKEVK